MGMLWRRSFSVLCLLLCCGACSVSGSQPSFPMRTLLQMRAPCPFDFGTVNYTSVTSVCQPPYPQEPCCNSFIALTCKYLFYFNNENTTCPDEMFAYLNNAGNYTGGLFANLCVAGPEGLPCPAVAPAPSPSDGVALRLQNSLALKLVWLLYMIIV